MDSERDPRTIPAPAAVWDEGEPSINGPDIHGASPGKDFMYLIPTLGERPIRFEADGLPPGIELDAELGRITGRAAVPGEYAVRLRASNGRGQAEKTLRIVIRENALALTPPLGWNSWNCFRSEIDTEKILRIARGMVESGLAARGYAFVNLDSGWQSRERGGPFNAIVPHDGFPDMGDLCGHVHAMGLKMGIYSGPYVVPWGTKGCGSTSGRIDSRFPMRRDRYIGLDKHEAEDVAQWADWGIDYVKYDWADTDMEHTERMSRALRSSPRDMVFSVTTSVNIQDGPTASGLCNLWRSNHDTKPTWDSVKKNGFGNEAWNRVIGPGHWFDLDMTAIRPRKGEQLSPDELIACFTCWAIRPSPILIDCIPDELDDFTTSVLCNEEVLAVNQDVLGMPAIAVSDDPAWPIQVKPLATGGYAVAFFNLSEEPGQSPELEVTALGLPEGAEVRDLWSRQDLNGRREKLSVALEAHGAKLFSVYS